jgi:hypothetical protein
MSDNMFIAVELNQRRAEAKEREKDKKSRVEYHARREAALLIVDRLENELENNVGWLKSKELEVLPGGRVCLCQRWGTSRTDASSTNNLQREARRRRASQLRGQKLTKRSSLH